MSCSCLLFLYVFLNTDFSLYAHGICLPPSVRFSSSIKTTEGTLGNAYLSAMLKYLQGS